MITQQMHNYITFTHKILFSSNMFRSLLWPSSRCLITRI